MDPSPDEFKAPEKTKIDRAFSRYIKDTIKEKRLKMASGDLELIIALCHTELDKRRCL